MTTRTQSRRTRKTATRQSPPPRPHRQPRSLPGDCVHPPSARCRRLRTTTPAAPRPGPVGIPSAAKTRSHRNPERLSTAGMPPSARMASGWPATAGTPLTTPVLGSRCAPTATTTPPTSSGMPPPGNCGGAPSRTSSATSTSSPPAAAATTPAAAHASPCTLRTATATAPARRPARPGTGSAAAAHAPSRPAPRRTSGTPAPRPPAAVRLHPDHRLP